MPARISAELILVPACDCARSRSAPARLTQAGTMTFDESVESRLPLGPDEKRDRGTQRLRLLIRQSNSPLPPFYQGKKTSSIELRPLFL